MNDVIFELKDVHFLYLGRYPALCGINIEVMRGQKIAIIGANGSGKSTLLHILDGLIFPGSGSARALGFELNEKIFMDPVVSNNFRKKVGLVFQNPDIQLFCPTVKEDILFGPLQLGLEKDEVRKRFEKLTDILGIRKLMDRSPHQLSIGEKRKVAIASTLIIDPEVLILDEPTAGLDPLTTRHIIDLLVQENKEGKTIITSTHDLHIVGELSDIVYVFSSDKKIVCSGHPEVVLKDMPLLREHNLVHIHSHVHDGKPHTHPHEHPGHNHPHP